jgi:hypothetical protein
MSLWNSGLHLHTVCLALPVVIAGCRPSSSTVLQNRFDKFGSFIFCSVLIITFFCKRYFCIMCYQFISYFMHVVATVFRKDVLVN